jgi:hypothetical protein
MQEVGFIKFCWGELTANAIVAAPAIVLDKLYYSFTLAESKNFWKNNEARKTFVLETESKTFP